MAKSKLFLFSAVPVLAVIAMLVVIDQHRNSQVSAQQAATPTTTSVR